MVEASYLGLTAVGWHNMLRHWWDWVLLGLLIFGVVAGSTFVAYAIIQAIRKSIQERRKKKTAPSPAVARYIQSLVSDAKPISTTSQEHEPPKTFGVFLGGFNTPPSRHQLELLAQWELLIVNPSQSGVLEAVARNSKANFLVGRVDVQAIAPNSSKSDSEIIKCLGSLTNYISINILTNRIDTPYTGVLIANWQASFSPTILNQYVRFIMALGLDVYLEVSGPEFLTDTETALLKMDVFKGVVLCNGSILRNGDRRNCFQMAKMQPTLRAVAAQACLRPISLMMWETITDDIILDLAVARRSFIWYKYYTAISWIGPESALLDAETARARSLADEPLGSLMWLKTDNVIDAQEFWRLNDTIEKEPLGYGPKYEDLACFIPDLSAKLTCYPPKQEVSKNVALVDDFDWTEHNMNTQNPFTFSLLGQEYTGLGCFPIGLEVTSKDFSNLCDQQRHLRSLGLLDPLSIETLKDIAAGYKKLYQFYNSANNPPAEIQAVQDLLHLLNSMEGKDTDQLRVFGGIEAGFKTSLANKFWGLYDVDPDSNTMEIYISIRAKDQAGTILHTFMSSRGYTRSQCLMAEIALAEQTGTLNERWQLSTRLCQDMEFLASSELLMFMQRLTVHGGSNYPVLCDRIRAACEYQLLEVPTLLQLREQNGDKFLRNEITTTEIIKARIAWYRQHGCAHPDLMSAIELFREVDGRVYDMLMRREDKVLEKLEEVLLSILKPGKVDASADIFALAIFCAFRKLGLEETYLEVMDRNALPNPHPDQAACFAEMFSMGSRCEWYLGVTPNVLGEIITAKHKVYYHANQPPKRDDNATETPNAYASSQIDIDPNYRRPKLPTYAQVTFLGIFAVPALIDILGLTILGRGLYLSTFMAEVEKTMATYAFMVALFLTGAIGTWISSGGSYYLHSMAFPAMNLFILARFTAGIAICVVGGLAALITVGIVKGFYAGFIFFIYFFFLTTYLSSLAMLAIYQLPDFMFQSGRIVIMQCIPILLISPVVTLWAGHDIIIYPSIMGVFLLLLLLGARRTVSQWSTWYHAIPLVNDKDVAKWYMAKANITADELQAMGASPIPRKALYDSVSAEIAKSWYQPSTKDEIVLKLVKGYTATDVLMDWYTRYSRTKMPHRYSPTWNLQTKAAVDTVRDMQKGLKLHNAFVHWRHAGSEVWIGVFYFVLALLDKWVAIFSGGSIVGLSAADSEVYRLAVGFGLAYYLFGAVALDIVAQPLWAAANKKSTRAISNLASLEEVGVKDAQSRRRLYWRSLFKFGLLHIWGLAVAAGMMWTFNLDTSATIMFLAYTGAYAGLLWYQYNRIFTGAKALKDLLLAVAIAFPLGLLLHHFFPTYTYSSVIALATGTWTAAFLSLFTSKIGTPYLSKKSKIPKVAQYYAHGTLGLRPGLSQTTLSEIFQSIVALPTELRYRLDPDTHPGLEVMENLVSTQKMESSQLIRDAFKSAGEMAVKTAEYWQKGEIVIDLVPTRHMIRQEQKMRAISRDLGYELHIFVFVGLDLVGDEWVMDIRRNCKVIAEAIINASAEARFELLNDHAALAELLTGYEANSKHDYEFELIPEGMKRQLEHSENERLRVITTADKSLLKWLLLGLDADIDWDTLPRDMRTYLLDRCCANTAYLTEEQLESIRKRFRKFGEIFSIEEHIGRCNLGVTLVQNVKTFVQEMEMDNLHNLPEPPDSAYENCLDFPISEAVVARKPIFYYIKQPIFRVFKVAVICAKFFVISLTADPEYQRELDYMISGKPGFIRWPVTFLLNGIWNFCKWLQGFIMPFFLFHNRDKINKLYSEMKGIKTEIQKSKIVIGSLRGPSTCFTTTREDGKILIHHYNGEHDTQPESLDKLIAINTYTPKMVLIHREEYTNSARVNLFTYEYDSKRTGGIRSRLPIQRNCISGALNKQVIRYDERGYISSGSAVKDENMVKFKFWYRKNAKFDDELIRAEYTLPHVLVKVSWCVPPTENAEKLDKWIPYTKVTEATFIQDDQCYESVWVYDHKFHPVITTTLNGEVVPTPPMIEYDWFDVLKKPRNSSYINDNPLFLFSSVKPSILSRALALNIQWFPLATSRTRTHLWKVWKDTKDIDAVTARWLDEMSLRNDKLMKPYWRARDWGRLRRAEEYIISHTDSIMARIDLDPEISSWSAIAFKVSDFTTFGLGGDSRINTRTITTQIRDTDSNLHILAMDTGTWPYEGGGVSACRRDMVNNLETVKWHVMAEMANDYGYPRFQIEKNVQSLTILPLWGLDFLTPTHGIFQNCLDSEVERKKVATEDTDIIKKFIPILTTLVRCSRAIKLEPYHLDEAAKALVDLNKYFQSSRHWSDVWTSDVVKEVWRELWLSEDVQNARPPSEWMEAERPTFLHLDNALDMWHRYLFIFSVPVPEKIPDVFQASHHFTGASYGVLCKLLRKCSLHVWDHCISWREVTVFLSSAMSFDSPFVCTSLMQLSRLASVLILTHADVVLPCADFFNPSWEIEIGTQQGTIGHRRTYNRKIDPVVNGITNMERFKPIETIKTKLPTVTMLSHIRFVKDIKNAILAADIIVNDWGFKDYQLDIYGDMEKAPTYSVECQEIIASKGLRDHVALKGLGNPMKVLEDTWVFMNSSVSEGLPLAMGEAALAGVPIICTDVGASFRVVVDKTGKRISKLIAPNDSMSLARAQISLLGLLDEWAIYADDPAGFAPKLPLRPTPEETKNITARIYEKQEYRRKLGMLSRQNILDSFSGERYLREHEQMLWVGKHQAPSFRETLMEHDEGIEEDGVEYWEEEEWAKH